MMILYFGIGLLATIFGSLVGLGGGVVIKPVLDAIGTYDLTTIGILSSFTVFSMAVVSTGKQMKKGFKVEKNMLIITAGSILGGGIGNSLFGVFLKTLNNEGFATAIQGFILAGLLILVLFKENFPKYHLKNYPVLFLIGMTLGTIASFLGVGGGPINVMVLVLLMNMDIKKAAITSILIILLSQFAKLILIFAGGGFGRYDLSMLYVMIPGGILGGFIGAHFNHKLSHEIIHKIFNTAIIALVILNFYNVVSSLV
ncbi:MULTISPECIES: sulfite exporter TauE/SafE family protein [Psychrilyobacter]|uniref:Probable membrane transporter protein n=1 Tax=Psychrilyobacter piezotolerans TaxID=2293438 RepID=A0ABX9KEA1_9FUSO|nr:MULTISPECIES: sulfite exporter TauE/SafE family protein [Psychrilyobacter]MCS5421681.1 sulfite exporter TauE/SafE family protein [Psychrilyobacter sp. S5]NDI78815.1 sulfite exporter TauE/SafE family protein [Psychrilyobacter piezotolerans]RDE59521.1 sulfite exporter TauE/SafE family protein [Psychrilyobacter sp. S5]REI39961.1 sulfite exporter TauE/SafE family protein [Psychrilyobacter piezotolerans]